jgi:RNA polymerase sigma-70 factor, ECF subfamily
LPAAPEEPPWVDPCPPELWEGQGATPEAVVAARESVKLAFLVALQHLPATQRAALLLRDVLGWSAAEVAELLDSSVPAVNSLLQRARATVEERRERRPEAGAGDPGVQELVSRYLAAWERADVPALVALLHDDVITSMPPIPGWFRGRDALGTFITPRIGQPGGQRVVPVRCAEEIALAFYRRAAGEPDFRGHAIQIVRVHGGAVTEIHAFLQPELFRHFGLPERIDR